MVGEVFQNLLPGEFLPGKGPVGEGEGEVGALCVGGLGQHRGLPPLLGPEGIDPPQPPPGAGGQLQQGEEGHQPPVSRVASGALAGPVRVHPQQAAVGHGELPRRAENGQPAPAEVVGVEDGVEDGLPHGPGQPFPLCGVLGQQGGDGGEPPGDHPIEGEEVLRGPRPEGGQGKACVSLLVGQAELGEHLPQRLPFAQEKEPRQGGVVPPVLPPPQDACGGEELGVGQVVPGVVGLAHGHEGPELPQVGLGQVGGGAALQHSQVGRGVLPVPEHGPDLLGGAVVVPLPVPAVGPGEGAVSDVHRPLVPGRPGHGDHQDLLPLDGVEGHILRG